MLQEPNRNHARPLQVKGQISIPTDEFGLYSEKIFDHMLRIERLKTERSNTPFLIVMIGVAHLFRCSKKSDFQIFAGTLNNRFREIDISGWYKNRSTIGIIFTGIPNTAAEIIIKKVEQVIEQTLPPLFGKTVTVSYQHFPQTETSELHHHAYPESKTNCPGKITAAIFKRATDISVAVIMLVFLTPVMLITAVVIKLTSPGPVLFRQERVGLRGQRFIFFKFRSMYVNNNTNIHKDFVTDFIKARNTETPEETDAFKIVNDCRVTPFGRILRKTSIDELPQLFNVLLGEMSLVGPRPPIPYEVNEYAIWHRRRIMEIKPGITGFWQVHGRSRTTFENMVRMDLHYIKHHNPFLDFMLLIKTTLTITNGAC